MSLTKVNELSQASALTQRENIITLQGNDLVRLPFSLLASYVANQISGNVTAVEAVEGGILFTFADGTNQTIEVSGGGGLAFDSVTFVDGYLHIQANGVDVIEPCYIGGGGGGGSDYGSTLRLVNRMGSRSLNINANLTTYPILYNWTSLDTTDESATGPGSATWYVGGSVVARQTVQQGDNSFDIRNYLTAGASNAVKLTIEDAYGNSRSVTWTVTVLSFGLTWNLDAMANHGSDALAVRMVPSGSGSKSLHVAVDGVDVYTATVTTTGRTASVTIPAQTHGAHTVTAWFTVTVDGTEISTDVLRHVGIWTVDGETAPVIATEYAELSVGQYATGALNYMIVNPSNETATATLAIDGTTANVVTVGRTMQTWTFRPTVVGSHTMTITCGATVARVALTCTDIGADISPVTNGLVLDLDPTGHSNADANRALFGYKDGNGTTHPLTFSSNFDWSNGGFRTDSEGVTALVVPRGCSVTFDRSLFSDDAATSGKEIKVIFKATKVRNYDADVMKSLQGGIGLRIQAQQASIASMAQSATVQYMEDRKVELDVNIESSSEDRIVQMWLAGVPSRAVVYDSSDNWVQPAPEPMVIGSEACDVWVYRVKMYSSTLTRQEILDNFIADTGDVTTMLARHDRNAIFTGNGDIDIAALASANPGLRIIKLGGERMTTSKEDPVLTAVELIYDGGSPEQKFTAQGVTEKAQGTSSLDYILAALNLDLDFSSATSWVDGAGNPITSFSMGPNDIPVTYLNVKLNVASSENANNVVLADDFNNFNPFTTAAKAADPRVRDTVKGYPCAIFFTNTGTVPTVVGSRTVQPGETILYGCGDLNNSKKNFAVFGQDNTTYPDQCCVEITNNNNGPCRFLENVSEAETWDDDGDFEFRYPKRPTNAMKNSFKAMHAWVVSTNRAAATDAVLETPVVYDGVSYSTDSAEYRAAKFKAEVGDWFSVDSLLFHYLFTERHCMPDNRAKNTFPAYEYDAAAGGYRWNYRNGYDFDTGEGTDNVGGLTFTYGLEDTDTVGNQHVFNAFDSVLWCNVRDCLADELATMFREREAAGAWSADRILAKFAAYQSARPEALVAEDMWNKYITPYLGGDASFLPMLLGNKTEQREQFERYQERYMSSKYSGSVALSDAINLRGNTPTEWTGVAPTGNMVLTAYSDMYFIVKYGNAGTVKVRARRNVPTTINCPAASLNDTEINIYGASNIAHIGSLAGLYTKRCTISQAKKLQSLILGSSATGYVNSGLESISVGALTLLETLDLRGLTALVQSLDLSTLSSLRELYTTRSGVTGITFADNCPLETASINDISQLTAKNIQQVETFACPGTSMAVLWVENSPGIDTLAIISAATGLYRGRLTDVSWTLANADPLTRLAALYQNAGIDASGNTIDGFVLTGTAHVGIITQREIDVLTEAFPDLTLTYDSLVTSHTVTFVNYDGSTLYVEHVRHGDDAVNPISAGYISEPTRPATVDTAYSYTGWDSALTGIAGDKTITAQFASATRYYSVRYWNGDDLLETDRVVVYGTSTYGGADIPDPSDTEIWMGWDAVASSVVSDMDIHAVFASPTMPTGPQYGHTYLYSDDPADDAAYTFSEFWGLHINGQCENYFAPGDKIKISITPSGYTDTSLILTLADFHHFKLTGSNDFATCVWHMNCVLSQSKAMNSSASNVGGWKLCTMKTWLNETVYTKLPKWWKKIIKQVEVLSTAGNKTTTITVSDDYLFLLSQTEVGFDSSAPYCDEIDAGAYNKVMPIFTGNNARIRKTANGTGSAQSWWLRSADYSSTSNYRTVNNNGTASSNSATNGYYVAFGFCT